MVLLHGLHGCGKSTLAQALAQKFATDPHCLACTAASSSPLLQVHRGETLTLHTIARAQILSSCRAVSL
jgi:predicted AAA+ superfamily ATPase